MASGEIDKERRGREVLYGALRPFLSALMSAYFRVRAVGMENVPSEGGVLIASNHQSFLDPIFLGIGQRRTLCFMARDTLFRFAPFGKLIRTLGAFEVRRGSRDHGAVRGALRRLRNGEALIVFPEGTRTRNGELGRLRGGVDLIAGRAGAPVVPAVIEGAYQAWPKGSLAIAPVDVWMAFGRPLTPPGRTELERDNFREELRRRMLGMQAALRRLRAGCPLPGDVSRARCETQE